MKKAYIKPAIEIEAYELSESIALSCIVIVNQGPGNPLLGEPECSYFEDLYGGFSTFAVVEDKSFYKEGDTCTCYYSSGGESYFTS